MKRRGKFRGKLLLLTIAPLAIAQVVTLFAVMRTVEVDVDRLARESLQIGGAVVDEFLASRAEQMRTSVQVLAADFGLKEAAATSDESTIRSVLENHSERVSADLAILLDIDGREVASTDRVIAGNPMVFPDLIEGAENRGSSQSVTVIEGVAYHAITVPLRAPVTIGWIVLGFRLDGNVASRIASLTGLETSVVRSTRGSVDTIATSNAAGVGAKPADVLLPAGSPLRGVYLVSESDNDALTLTTPFIAGRNGVLVILQRSMLEAMAPYTEARRQLLLFSALLLALVAVAAAWLSGTVSRPLQTLTDAARRMMAGRYDSKVSVQSDDEFGELAGTFNAMQTAIAEREKHISYQATHDPLTELPNRLKTEDLLATAIARADETKSGFAVLSLCLSRMDAISSSLGHSAGDEVVRLAARHLKVNLAADEVLAHVGTNEFVLLLPNHDIDDALAYADRIEGILGAGVTLGRVNITLQTEIGIAAFPGHSRDAAELLRFSSIARAEAHNRRERVAVYESGREDHYVRQLRIVNDLRGALQKDEIRIVYQPKIRLPGGSVCGAEALVRWEHPELGFLSPDDFIPVAEQSGTIVHLTRHILGRAIRQCRLWQDAGHALQVSVNISARDLHDEYLPYYVLEMLKEHDIPPNRLTLEITESAVMYELRHSLSVLECLRDIGVRVSMDDFGTGHSSLAQLKNMPLHELKIDKSFIMTLLKDDRNEAIVKTTIELAHNMGLDVVAEGIEDEATLRHISGMGCQQAQGYFLSRPVPPEVLLEWVRTRTDTPFPERRRGARSFARRA